LSIDKNSENGKNQVIVYPTIVSNTLFFSKSIQSIRVFNLLGKTLIQKTSADFSQIDVSNLSSGMYLIRINDNQTSKFYKN
jgi:hypothetical protein